MASVPYDPFKDFTPITLATRGPLLLTLHTSVPATNVKELVNRVNAVLVQALPKPQVHDTIAKGAYETAPSTPAELATEIRSACVPSACRA